MIFLFGLVAVSPALAGIDCGVGAAAVIGGVMGLLGITMGLFVASTIADAAGKP